MIYVLAIAGWLAALGLTLVVRVRRIWRTLETTKAELRGAEYREAAWRVAWEESHYRRERPARSFDLEGFDSFVTVEDLTRGKP